MFGVSTYGPSLVGPSLVDVVGGGSLPKIPKHSSLQMQKWGNV